MRNLRYEPGAGGEPIELDGPLVYVGTADGLRGRAWSYDLGRRGISYQTRGAREVPITASALDMAAVDVMRHAFDSDVAAGKPGVLVSGEWSIRSYVVKSEPSLISKNIVHLDLTVVLADGTWRRKRTAQFTPSSASAAGGLNYPHNHLHNYSPQRTLASVVNDSTTASDVIITVYGPAANPYVVIGDNRYQVDASVPAGGYMVIDGVEKSIKVVASNGDTSDVFDAGVRGSGKGSGEYVFEKLPPGYRQISWANGFGFDLVWFEEEGELPWS